MPLAPAWMAQEPLIDPVVRAPPSEFRLTPPVVAVTLPSTTVPASQSRSHTFHARDVLEVETPILSVAGNTEPNIDSFHTRFSGHVDAGSPQRW